MTRLSLGWLALLATAFLAVHAVLASCLFDGNHDPIFYGTSVEVALYALACLVVLRDQGTDPAASRRALVFILIFAGILRLMLLFADPVSTDINRYKYIPADPALSFLRDDEIYPEINRADYAHTIYPPLAQIVFFLVTRISETITAMKLAMVGFEIAAVWAILRLLKAYGIKANRVLLYVWHPLPLWEFSGSGHVDAIAVASVMLALLAAESRRPFLAGIALGGAALVKFFPVVVAPAIYRRWDWRLPLAGAATVILLYLPYLSAGPQIFGFLGGYADEEGLRDGSGLYPWVLLRHIVPVPQSAFALYMPVAALILAGLGLYVLFARQKHRSGHGADIAGAFLIVTVYTVLTSPHFPWYFAWVIPFLCFVPYWPVLYLTGSSTLLYIAGWPPRSRNSPHTHEGEASWTRYRRHGKRLIQNVTLKAWRRNAPGKWSASRFASTSR
jgi:alpha-1,6-mannosyltransferase